MIISRERKIMDALLVTCVAAGFLCFALIVLPDQLKKAGVSPSAHSEQGGLKNISSIISLNTGITTVRAEKPSPGIVARFEPEPMPKDPFAKPQPDTAKPMPNGQYDMEAAGGAGVAIDEQSSESALALNSGAAMQPPARDDDTKSAESEPASQTLPAGSTPPTLHQFRASSIARHETAQTDTDRGKRAKPWLMTPQGLEADVAFWRDIYTKYDRNAVVLHHPRHLNIVYDVVDLKDIDSDPRLNDIEKARWKENRIDERREKIVEILKKLATNPVATLISEEEMQIKKLFDNVKEANAFRRAYDDDGVRAQLGQSDKFIPGLAYSGRYLGEIEAIFESYGIPREITRLIFVESMFNPNAVSSAGASGIWQFMRSTGKLYLRVNDIVDERNDPILATHAAAKLLQRNYESLGSWPLAINAYNAGRGRLEQAVAQTGTTDIARIIRDFSHPSYGFASRNFFLEFLAAYDVAEHADKYFDKIEYDKPLRYESVQTQYHVSLPDVVKTAGLAISDIEELNPAFGNAVLTGRKLLPTGFEIRVPEKKGEIFLAAAARAPRSRTGPLNHVVGEGETLSSIAAMYGITPASILKSNQHVGRQLSLGQTLTIPQK